MQLSDFISLFALVVAAVAVFQTRKFNNSQMMLIARQADLTRMLADKERKGFAESNEAYVSANMYKTGKSNWKIRIYNKGPAVAKNVSVSSYSENGFIQESFLTEKFPMDKMEVGQSVDIHAFVVSGSKDKETIELTWDDQSKLKNKNQVEITI